ncbi:hypothetical protein KO116_00130 [Halomonas sp. KO116]|nr:hypothetical protein KO116_00130 [Halomonas sp. KO116]
MHRFHYKLSSRPTLSIHAGQYCDHPGFAMPSFVMIAT